MSIHQRLEREERGQAHLPDLETLQLADHFRLESRSISIVDCKIDQLPVRKAGLPPLFRLRELDEFDLSRLFV